MTETKALNTRYVLFTRYGGEEDEKHSGNGKDKQQGADSDTCGDKKEVEDEGRREGDVHGRREHFGDEEAGGLELGGADEADSRGGHGSWTESGRYTRNSGKVQEAEKTKITADTNVLLSASLWLGCARRVISLVEEGKINLVLSEDILREYEKVLGYEEVLQKIKKNRLKLSYTPARLREIAAVVEPNKKINVVIADPDDNKIIEAAFEGKAHFILTYDKHLLRLRRYERIRITTPEGFLGRLE